MIPRRGGSADGTPRPAPARASHSIYATQSPGLRRYWRFVKDVFAEAMGDDLPLLAAALAHFALLSFIPILLLSTSVLGMYLSAGRAQEQALEMIAQWLPAAETREVDGEELPPAKSTQQLTSIFQAIARERGAVGGIGLVALLWICLRIFTTLQRALDRIWDIEHHKLRPIYLQYPIALFTILTVGLFAWISVALTSLVSSLRFNWPAELVGHGFELPDLVTVASILVSLSVSIWLMFLVYRWLPSARVRSRSATYGAVVAGVLWELSKHAFAWFVTYQGDYGQFYGAMGGIVIVMLWFYITAYIVLLGAEVVYCHAKWIAATPVLEEEETEEALGASHALSSLSRQVSEEKRPDADEESA